MVKHAADDGQPLLNAEERVNGAIERVSTGKTFSKEQVDWLNRIRQHLVANLTIEPADFDHVPILQQPGGWTRANRAFDGQLSQVLRDLNCSIAL
jgi:type I restriction enzyme R subunit